MKAGTLDQRVTIKSQSTTQDSIGQPLTTWSDVCTVWASILHKNGSESIKADQDTSKVPASIRIRTRSGITAAMRAYHGTTIYEIKAVTPDANRSGHMDLVCELVNG